MGGLATFAFVAGTTVFVVAALGFAVGGVLRGTETTRKFYAVVALGAGTLAVVYAASGFGVGVVRIGPPERIVYALQYAGWLVVTPLLLVALWWLAASDRQTLAALVGLDALGVLAAAAGVLATRSVAGLSVRETRLALLGASAVLFLAVLVVVFRVLSPQAGRQPSEVGILFSILRNLLTLVWVLYPVVWIVGPGLGLVGVGAETAAAALLNFVGVVVLGVVLVRDDETLARAGTGRTLLGRGLTELRTRIRG